MLNILSPHCDATMPPCFPPPSHLPPAPPPSGYSNEITTFLGGWGLEGLLSSRAPVLSGIVNGIDEEE